MHRRMEFKKEKVASVGDDNDDGGGRVKFETDGRIAEGNFIGFSCDRRFAEGNFVILSNPIKRL